MDEETGELTGEETTRKLLKVLDQMDDFLEGMDRRICLEGQRDTQMIRESIGRYGGVPEAVAGEIQNISARELYDLHNIAIITHSVSLYETVCKEANRRGLLEGECETT